MDLPENSQFNSTSTQLLANVMAMVENMKKRDDWFGTHYAAFGRNTHITRRERKERIGQCNDYRWKYEKNYKW